MKKLLSILLVLTLVGCSKVNVSYDTSVDVMGDIWGRMNKDLPVFGGNLMDQHMDSPGEFKLDAEDAEAELEAMYYVPVEVISSLKDGATCVHLMNQNTFTSACFKVDNPKEVGEKIADNIRNANWMCGFPDKLVMMMGDTYVIYAFGAEELVDSFKKTVEDAFMGTSKVLVDEYLAY